MRRWSVLSVASLLLVLAASLLSPAPPAARADECVTFTETGHQVCGRFLDYWRTHGGLAQQGLPLTDPFTEVSPTNHQPYTVQYFERARFEYHPENQPPFDVLLGLLGAEQYTAKYPTTPPPPFPGDPFNDPNLPQDCATIGEGGFPVCSVFLVYWQEHGGLAQQGLPLTGVIFETNPTDGKTYPTQYFERARFEYHEENQPPYNVLLGLLGREQFLAKYPNGVPTSPPPPADNFQLVASVSNPMPQQQTTVRVTAVLTNNGQGVAGATLDTVWHYKTTTSYCSGGPSASDGSVGCSQPIGQASQGDTVSIDVIVHYQGRDFTTRTSFTAQ